MYMNKAWYEIDVKKEVLEKLAVAYMKYHPNEHFPVAIIDISIRELMDTNFWRKTGCNEVASMTLATFAKEQYFAVRTAKYGQCGLWLSAHREREIGYDGKWYEFISGLLSQYCPDGSKVLFVGTADGSEIPRNNRWQYYALEQIENSLANLYAAENVKSVLGDFEDKTLLIDGGGQMTAICALRCLMPNTRLIPFLTFCRNNLVADGGLILSHPLSCLYADGSYGSLPEADRKRQEFEIRLEQALQHHDEFSLIKKFETSVEYFYIIKRRKNVCLCYS